MYRKRDQAPWSGWLLLAGALVALGLVGPAWSAEQGWSTYRGNLQRTGNTDDRPGPAAPRVLWAMKSRDHFIASPVPCGDRLLISGLGGFNTSTLFALDTAPGAAQRVAWS